MTVQISYGNGNERCVGERNSMQRSRQKDLSHELICASTKKIFMDHTQSVCVSQTLIIPLLQVGEPPGPNIFFSFTYDKILCALRNTELLCASSDTDIKEQHNGHLPGSYLC